MNRIAFIIGGMGRGGAERVISILANDYIEKGWSVDIIMLLQSDVAYELDESIRVLDHSGNGDARLKRLPMWLKKLRHYAKKEKPNVILSFACRINVITLLATVGLRQNIFVSERSDPGHDNRGRAGDLLAKLLYPHAKAVIFQTSIQQSYFKRLHNGVLIPNPVSVSTMASQKKEKKIVTIGRLSAEKNHKLLIAAYSNIMLDFPGYILEIYGEGNLWDELKEYIAEKDLTDYVFLRGNIPNVHERIADAELFVLSSDYEGMSNALIEAMMMGLPVITTDVSGTDESVQDGINGLVVPVGDEKALTDAIKKLLADSELRSKLGIKAKETSMKFMKEPVVKAWHQLLD